MSFRALARIPRFPQTYKYLRRTIKCYSGEPASCSSTGALRCRPPITQLGIIKVVAIVASSVCVGAMISKSGAEFLEENEIFVPEDD